MAEVYSGELSTEKYILWGERNEKGIVFYSACRWVVRWRSFYDGVG